MERVRQLVNERGMSDRVRITGRVPHDRVDAYYSLLDVAVYPRLPMRLTELVTPLKPLEAMAQGRIVIASDVGGHRELIRHGETGLLFEQGNAEKLARVVSKLLSEPDSWADLRKAGRRFVEEERTWSRSVERYGPVYGAALNNRQAA